MRQSLPKAAGKRQAGSAPADTARHKAILGAFLVAQFRHKPESLAWLRPDIERHVRGCGPDTLVVWCDHP